MAPAVLAVDRWLAERPPTSDLVWVDDGLLWLSGPETTAVGVGFRPGVGPPMLGLAASAGRDARVRLDELWGDRRARELAERVAAHPDDRGRARELERAVRRLAATARPVDAVALEVAARLNQPQHLAHEVRAIMGTTLTRLLRSTEV
jgi:hypothetical protein